MHLSLFFETLMKSIHHTLIPVLALLLTLQVLSPAAIATQVEIWRTREDLSEALTPVGGVEFVESIGATATITPTEAGSFVVDVDDSTFYQSIDGWGASMTGASAWLLTYQLSDEKRKDVMQQLFSEQGIGLSFLRQPIGASDFNHEIYSYCDTVGDVDLETFSVSQDDVYIVPRLQEAIAINGELKVMASPWSPPGWMKTSGSMIGGKLMKQHYTTLAAYFLKFIEAYELRGIPIYAVTPQNEPGYMPPHYPGMLMSAEQQVEFVREHLGPVLRASCYSDVKIICHDHNYDTVDYPREVLASPAYEFVAGSGFHHYGGSIEAMSALHQQFPEKGIWFTEGGFGDWNTNFDNIVHEMIAIPRNWAKSIILWNIALDQHDQPAVLNPDNTNDGLLLIRSDATDEVHYQSLFYYLGHLSKFVKPGALRISSPSDERQLETVAFLNRDGSRVLVAANRNALSISMKLRWSGKESTLPVPGRSMITLKWKPLAEGETL